jgi:hypothetical protein
MNCRVDDCCGGMKASAHHLQQQEMVGGGEGKGLEDLDAAKLTVRSIIRNVDAFGGAPLPTTSLEARLSYR